jgi:CheY-like chemotaxis protein
MRPPVLVVEDDAATRTLLDVVLRRAGFEVDVVPSGSDALPLLTSVRYAAMTFDLYMRGVSGHDLLAFTAANKPELLDRIVVVSSAPAAELAAVRGQYPGVRSLRKPFELDELFAVVTEASQGAGVIVRDLHQEFCRRSVLCGAKSGIALTRKSGSQRLEIAVSYGYTPESLERFLPISVDDPYPLATAYRLGRGVWLSSVTAAESQYPLLASVWKAHESHALAAVPLVSAGSPVGAVGWSFREPRGFDDPDRERLLKIAEHLSKELGLSEASRKAC